MIVSIMQPAYLPWLGYFHRVAVSDIHIVLDHVEIDRNSRTKFANRNKVRIREGWTWLTVPLKTKGNSGHLFLNRLQIDNSSPWAEKHWGTIMQNYTRATYFASHARFFEEVYAHEWGCLTDLTREITRYLTQVLGLQTRFLFSSEMGVEGQKDVLILNLCRAVGATHYLSGPLGREYLREPLFSEAGIQVIYHDYQHPRYPQRYPGFEPNMSVVDLVFNTGAKSWEILSSAQKRIEA